MSNKNNGQSYNTNEYRHEMPYKGAAHGAETPTSGYIAGTHAHITDKLRKDQLKDIGLETREEYIDSASASENAAREIRRQRIKRNCLIFAAIFILAILSGIIVSTFYGLGIIVGLIIGTAVGTVLFLAYMLVYFITNRHK